MMFGRGFWHYGDGFRYFGYYHGIGILLMLALIIGVFIILRKSSIKSSNDEILNVLKMKYVNGEITEEEYISKKNILLKR